MAQGKKAAVEREQEVLKARHEPLMERFDSVHNEVESVKAKLAAALTSEDGRRLLRRQHTGFDVGYSFAGTTRKQI